MYSLKCKLLAQSMKTVILKGLFDTDYRNFNTEIISDHAEIFGAYFKVYTGNDPGHSSS